MNGLKKVLSSFMIAGAIILATGLYYLVAKAGIPYQDPPVDIQIQYAINSGIGNTLASMGFFMTVAGAIGRLAAGIAGRAVKKKG